MDDSHWDFSTLVDSFAAEDRSPRARVRRLVAWILEDPTRPHRVGALAERAAVSPRTLSRLFRRETGVSPAKFVERARLALARALIEETGLRIDSVAARTGFGSAERMRRTFHRSLGANPLSFRLRNDA